MAHYHLSLSKCGNMIRSILTGEPNLELYFNLQHLFLLFTSHHKECDDMHYTICSLCLLYGYLFDSSVCRNICILDLL